MHLKRLKKIVFPVFSLFLCYRSIEQMRGLLSSEPNQYSADEVLIMAFILTLFMTGVFAFIGFAYPSSSMLSDRYYEIKNSKALTSISTVLGVKYFQRLLLFAFWGRETNRRKYFDGTKRGLRNFIFQTKQSEFGHLGAFVVITILSLVLLAHGYILLVGAITLINIVGNGYPVILQRSHRMRIDRIMRYHKV